LQAGPARKATKCTGNFTIYQLQLHGTMNFNGEDRDVNRTTTVEIKDVGSTKVEVPDPAKKKLS
jgi:hypothetical protein